MKTHTLYSLCPYESCPNYKEYLVLKQEEVHLKASLHNTTLLRNGLFNNNKQKDSVNFKLKQHNTKLIKEIKILRKKVSYFNDIIVNLLADKVSKEKINELLSSFENNNKSSYNNIDNLLTSSTNTYNINNNGLLEGRINDYNKRPLSNKTHMPIAKTKTCLFDDKLFSFNKSNNQESNLDSKESKFRSMSKNIINSEIIEKKIFINDEYSRNNMKKNYRKLSKNCRLSISNVEDDDLIHKENIDYRNNNESNNKVNIEDRNFQNKILIKIFQADKFELISDNNSKLKNTNISNSIIHQHTNSILRKNNKNLFLISNALISTSNSNNINNKNKDSTTKNLKTSSVSFIPSTTTQVNNINNNTNDKNNLIIKPYNTTNNKSHKKSLLIQSSLTSISSDIDNRVSNIFSPINPYSLVSNSIISTFKVSELLSIDRLFTSNDYHHYLIREVNQNNYSNNMIDEFKTKYLIEKEYEIISPVKQFKQQQRASSVISKRKTIDNTSSNNININSIHNININNNNINSNFNNSTNNYPQLLPFYNTIENNILLLTTNYKFTISVVFYLLRFIRVNLFSDSKDVDFDHPFFQDMFYFNILIKIKKVINSEQVALYLYYKNKSYLKRITINTMYLFSIIRSKTALLYNNNNKNSNIFNLNCTDIDFSKALNIKYLPLKGIAFKCIDKNIDSVNISFNNNESKKYDFSSNNSNLNVLGLINKENTSSSNNNNNTNNKNNRNSSNNRSNQITKDDFDKETDLISENGNKNILCSVIRNKNSCYIDLTEEYIDNKNDINYHEVLSIKSKKKTKKADKQNNSNDSESYTKDDNILSKQDSGRIGIINQRNLKPRFSTIDNINNFIKTMSNKTNKTYNDSINDEVTPFNNSNTNNSNNTNSVIGVIQCINNNKIEIDELFEQNTQNKQINLNKLNNTKRKKNAFPDIKEEILKCYSLYLSDMISNIEDIYNKKQVTNRTKKGFRLSKEIQQLKKMLFYEEYSHTASNINKDILDKNYNRYNFLSLYNKINIDNNDIIIRDSFFSLKNSIHMNDILDIIKTEISHSNVNSNNICASDSCSNYISYINSNISYMNNIDINKSIKSSTSELVYVNNNKHYCNYYNSSNNLYRNDSNENNCKELKGNCFCYYCLLLTRFLSRDVLFDNDLLLLIDKYFFSSNINKKNNKKRELNSKNNNIFISIKERCSSRGLSKSNINDKDYINDFENDNNEDENSYKSESSSNSNKSKKNNSTSRIPHKLKNTEIKLDPSISDNNNNSFNCSLFISHIIAISKLLINKLNNIYENSLTQVFIGNRNTNQLFKLSDLIENKQVTYEYGIITHVFNSEKPFFSNIFLGCEYFNKNIDICTSENIYTFPIILKSKHDTINNNSVNQDSYLATIIIQIEYSLHNDNIYNKELLKDDFTLINEFIIKEVMEFFVI